jgi:hypothetical protein
MVMLICDNGKEYLEGDGCTPKCTKHINITINLQDWPKTSSFKDDHDDQWATIGLLWCYLGDH